MSLFPGMMVKNVSFVSPHPLKKVWIMRHLLTFLAVVRGLVWQILFLKKEKPIVSFIEIKKEILNQSFKTLIFSLNGTILTFVLLLNFFLTPLPNL